jgi:hypothetical protein
LAQFLAKGLNLDIDPIDEELYLYHGTNCYRRWEIKRTGFIEPGRSNYSFFCTRAADAFTYARAACMRDISPGSVNSLTCEPVVLKVKINSRTWLQVDFIKDMGSGEQIEEGGLSVAIVGPISSSFLVDVLHCMHGRRLGCTSESTRTFEDGTFLVAIYNLRDKLNRKRPDAWVMKHLGSFSQSMSVRLSGGEVPELTLEDSLRRLRQVRA